jgi:ABC-type polysaccharide/polyol phosphate export permease
MIVEKKIIMFDTFWKYRDYIKYASFNNLQARYKNMYLGVFWIFLDPLLYVAVLSFVKIIIFDNPQEDIVVFLLIGLVVWKLFSSSLVGCSSSIYSRMGIIEQVPVPKQLFTFIDLITQTYVFLISFALIFIAMFLSSITFTWHIIEVIPITLVFLVLCYGFALIVSHFGAKIADLKMGLIYLSWLLFFITPIFYNLSSLPENVQKIILLNPATIFIESYRNVMMHGVSPDYFILSEFLLVGVVLIFLGNRLITKNDKKYVLMK